MFAQLMGECSPCPVVEPICASPVAAPRDSPILITQQCFAGRLRQRFAICLDPSRRVDPKPVITAVFLRRRFIRSWLTFVKDENFGAIFTLEIVAASLHVFLRGPLHQKFVHSLINRGFRYSRRGLRVRE